MALRDFLRQYRVDREREFNRNDAVRALWHWENPNAPNPRRYEPWQEETFRGVSSVAVFAGKDMARKVPWWFRMQGYASLTIGLTEHLVVQIRFAWPAVKDRVLNEVRCSSCGAVQ